MLKIRLSRKGRKKSSFFRIIVSDSRFDTQGRFLENLGHFDPKNKKHTLVLKKERILHWLSQGAQASATVHNILVSQKIIAGPKIKAASQKKKKEAEKKKEEKIVAPENNKATANQSSAKPLVDKSSDKIEAKTEVAKPEIKESVKQEKAVFSPADKVITEKKSMAPAADKPVDKQVETKVETKSEEPKAEVKKEEKNKGLLIEKARVEKILARHAKKDPKIANNYIANFQNSGDDTNEEEKEVFEFEEAELNSDIVQKMELRLQEINKELDGLKG